MKTVLFFVSLFAISASAQTVIYYEDGTTYTLKDREEVFVSKTGKVYKKQAYRNGNVFFTKVAPSTQTDPDAQPWDGMERGSDEWCEAYVPYQFGYTFDDQLFERACDG